LSKFTTEKASSSFALRTPFFERAVEACIAAGLAGGEGFAVDASVIVADANKQRSIQRWLRYAELVDQFDARPAAERLRRRQTKRTAALAL
jgi:hypothetical protein